MADICEVQYAGCVSYAEAWAWQRRLATARGAGQVPDRLLLLEHPPTYTLGRSGHQANLLIGEEELQRRGIAVFHVDRGGDITFHGPGQLVGYPILGLRREAGALRADVVDYVRKLEQVVMALLAEDGVAAGTIPGLTGVWVGDEKVCAIGVRVDVKAVTSHGFALNLNTELRYFDGIIPCGIRDKGVTSLARLLGHPVDEAALRARLIRHFGRVFGLTMQPGAGW